MCLAKIDVPALISASIGGFLVLLAYFFAFQNEKGSYVKSRFGMGVPESTATALIPLQFRGLDIYIGHLYIGHLYIVKW